MAPSRARKKSQGRRKIEMKLIADENARTVTFSKRRAGLFKKATELSILCGAQVALIIFSLGGRAYSFGHPNVESVVGRFFNRNPMPNLQDSVHMRFHAAMLQQLKEQCDQKNEEVEAKKRRGKEIETALENSPCQISDERLSLLDINQLKQLKEMMEKLRENVRLRLRVNAPRVESVKPPPNSMNAEPPNQKDVDLANVERDEREASPIPPDWLKL
ncbi:Agamous-like MADS-box protein [Sesamum angolense]|uniref:Agamous-like MADS-box protein n=1 Tax=Sesamum angolense TaxID=2727404 RepID=A0AAE2BVV7_9LAMI|nr:Agamous-like MADS-box protein [Sesamum angolense]